MLTAKYLPVLNKCVSDLLTQLVTKQEELRRRETSCGTYHDPRKMTRLREQIASLERRLGMAEKLQEAALAAKE